MNDSDDYMKKLGLITFGISVFLYFLGIILMMNKFLLITANVRHDYFRYSSF